MEQYRHTEVGPRALLAVARGATAAGLVLAAAISICAATTIGCFGLLSMSLRRDDMTASGPGCGGSCGRCDGSSSRPRRWSWPVGLGMAAAGAGRLR